ncbi:MAG: hypothetical protein ONB05_06730 [candidate division KSB1 bacterium]|nr:hypothetical protein [candidate division KSB1 bacterium]
MKVKANVYADTLLRVGVNWTIFSMVQDISPEPMNGWGHKFQQISRLRDISQTISGKMYSACPIAQI